MQLVFKTALINQKIAPREPDESLKVWCSMSPMFRYAVLNSTFVTLRQGGIRWRETFYPLKTLRAGNVR